jgi:opacity protein-like surface antigen
MPQLLRRSDVTVRLIGGVKFRLVAGAFMRSVLGGVVIAALAAAPALASEMTMPGPEIYYSKATQSYYDWTGFYVGALAGYARANIDSSTIATNTGAFDSASSITVNNAQLGGQLGFDYISPWSHVLIGVAIDANSGFDHTVTFSNPGGTNVYTQETKMAASGTARARLGYAFNNVLLYGTGGWAWAMATDTRTQVVGTTNGAHPGTSQAFSPSTTGWTAGGGLAIGFWRNWEVFAEYRYVSYAGTSVAYSQALRTTASTITASSVLGGVNLKFNPIMGRY